MLEDGIIPGLYWPMFVCILTENLRSVKNLWISRKCDNRNFTLRIQVCWDMGLCQWVKYSAVTTFLQNVWNHLPTNKTLCPRRPNSSEKHCENLNSGKVHFLSNVLFYDYSW